MDRRRFASRLGGIVAAAATGLGLGMATEQGRTWLLQAACHPYPRDKKGPRTVEVRYETGHGDRGLLAALERLAGWSEETQACTRSVYIRFAGAERTQFGQMQLFIYAREWDEALAGVRDGLPDQTLGEIVIGPKGGGESWEHLLAFHRECARVRGDLAA